MSHVIPEKFAHAIRDREPVGVGVFAALSRGSRSDELRVIRGQVTRDSDDHMLWSGELECLPPTTTLSIRPDGLYAPYGSECSLRVLLELADGDRFTLPYGRMLVSAAVRNWVGSDLTIELTLVDLAERVERYRFERPTKFPSGDLAQLVNAVLTDRLGVSPNLPNVGVSVGSVVLGTEAEKGPWTEVSDIVAARSHLLFHTREGNLRLVPQPSLGQGVRPHSWPPQLQSLSTAMDQLPPNVVVARGEAMDDTPVGFAIARDEDPASPWFIDGPYGRVTRYYSSPVLENDEQAASAAESVLRNNLGAAVLFDAEVGLDLETDPWDTVTLNTGGVDEAGTPPAQGTTVDALVSTVSVELPAGPTTITGRLA